MSDNSFYQLVFIVACIYWINQNCRSRNNQSVATSESRNQIANGGTGVTATGSGNNSESDATRRRELVREHLEFRTISAPPPPSSEKPRVELESGTDTDDKKDETTHAATAESDDCDLEKGRESLSPPSNIDSSENTTTTTTAANNNNSSDRSLISSIFQRQSTRTDLNASTETSPRGSDKNDVEDPPISSNENHFSIAFLLQSIGLTTSGPERRQQECCSICLEPYKVGDRVARLKPENHASGPVCNHWFHEDCILEWLQNHNECPLCRVNMVQS